MFSSKTSKLLSVAAAVVLSGVVGYISGTKKILLFLNYRLLRKRQ